MHTFMAIKLFECPTNVECKIQFAFTFILLRKINLLFRHDCMLIDKKNVSIKQFHFNGIRFKLWTNIQTTTSTQNPVPFVYTMYRPSNRMYNCRLKKYTKIHQNSKSGFLSIKPIKRFNPSMTFTQTDCLYYNIVYLQYLTSTHVRIRRRVPRQWTED